MAKIGLKRGLVKLNKHDEAWEINAAQTIEKLNSMLKNIVIDAQHIGSTAIKHIVAKPIIDVVVGVHHIKDVKDKIQVLENNGFFHRPNNDMDDYMMFVCGDMQKEIRTHHIHFVIYSNEEWQNQINFRDYLNANISAAKKYEKLKIELCDEYKNNRYKYTQSKDYMIKLLQQEAYMWKVSQ